MNIGAVYKGDDKCKFRVWSPFANDIKVRITYPEEKLLQLEKENDDYWVGEFQEIIPGTRYKYRINKGFERPDPASNYQPFDVHSESEVIDHSSFKWNDNAFKEIPLEQYIIYELHIGTFTPEGTFQSAIEKIGHLKDVGINVVEIMPVAQFPGERNWGYDGVHPFAPQNTYGGPEGLKKLIDALHYNGFSVILDVVYNHLGPEGNYLSQYAPYFTNRYQTPWGNAVNFDGKYSDNVRNYFIENALYWFEYYHFDGLRLDAIDRIYDQGAKHFLQELAESVSEYNLKKGKKKILIAESDLNDDKIIRPLDQKGFGIDAQWSDDFHHSLHALITGEKDGYYQDFGTVESLIKSIKNSYVYDGKFSKYRKRRHGNSAAERNLNQFVVCIQNHDQIGNRGLGERINSLISFELYKLSSALVILSPYIPLIFMGQEFFDTSPFLYFVSHSDPDLIKAVQKGRRKEFGDFKWSDEIPDPFAEETFNKSKLQWDYSPEPKGAVVYALYKKLIQIRKKHPVYKQTSRSSVDVKKAEEYKVILLHRQSSEKNLYFIISFEPETVTLLINIPEGNWRKVLDTSDTEWLGSGVSTEKQLIGKQQSITIKRESLVLYESE
jgi:maltooligosyltrehalose trehalohydrolase